MKILKKKKKKKKKKKIFEIGIFFFKLGKKSPKSHWERGRTSAPEDTKKIPGNRGCQQADVISEYITAPMLLSRCLCKHFTI